MTVTIADIDAHIADWAQRAVDEDGFHDDHWGALQALVALRKVARPTRYSARCTRSEGHKGEHALVEEGEVIEQWSATPGVIGTCACGSELAHPESRLQGECVRCRVGGPAPVPEWCVECHSSKHPTLGCECERAEKLEAVAGTCKVCGVKSTDLVDGICAWVCGDDRIAGPDDIAGVGVVQPRCENCGKAVEIGQTHCGWECSP